MALPKSYLEYPKVNVLAVRVMMLFWLAGWFLKASFFVPYLLCTTVVYPVVDAFFPSLFMNPFVAIAFYLLPLLIVPVVVLKWQRWFLASAVLMVVCAAMLNLHINTCNDATFVTSFWSALWLCWLVRHVFETDDSFKLQARVLAQCVVAIMFMGGVVGKLTPEYWSGEIFRQIFIEQGGSSPLGEILGHVFGNVQGIILAYLAKIIIGVELLLGIAPLLPYRFVMAVMVMTSVGISLFSTWRIFSVLLCLLGMLIAGQYLQKKTI
ncbi:MAG: hypothetical protein H6753_02990 [Candidatus Omnitrophica bacterium]|nr:hypothetical protein [Candidatus Omnitrophota bacterium]